MPMYLFENNGEIREIYFKMNDEKRYFDEAGNEWSRVFTKPNAAFDTILDVNSSKDFIRHTNKKGTIGNVWDASKEWSEKRGGNSGQDEVKQDYYKNYSSQRAGKLHPEQRKEKLKESLKNSPFEIDI